MFVSHSTYQRWQLRRVLIFTTKVLDRFGFVFALIVLGKWFWFIRIAFYDTTLSFHLILSYHHYTLYSCINTVMNRLMLQRYTTQRVPPRRITLLA